MRKIDGIAAGGCQNNAAAARGVRAAYQRIDSNNDWRGAYHLHKKPRRRSTTVSLSGPLNDRALGGGGH